MVPWQQYEFDGDLNLFRIHYDAMKEYLDYFASRADNNIADFGLGDWYDIGPKKPGVMVPPLNPSVVGLEPLPLWATGTS